MFGENAKNLSQKEVAGDFCRGNTKWEKLVRAFTKKKKIIQKCVRIYAAGYTTMTTERGRNAPEKKWSFCRKGRVKNIM